MVWRFQQAILEGNYVKKEDNKNRWQAVKGLKIGVYSGKNW